MSFDLYIHFILKINFALMPDMVANAINPNLWEAEVARWLPVQGQHSLHIEFQSSQGYTVEPYIKKIRQSKEFIPIRYEH